MKLKSILLIIVSIALLSSCSEKDAILVQLSEMVEQSESSLDTLKSIYPNDIDAKKKEANKALENVKPYIEVLNQDMIQKYGALSNTIKLIQKKPFNRKKLEEEINFNTTQIKALYTARVRGTMNEDDIKKHIKEEVAALEKTANSLSYLKETYRHIYRNFDLFIPPLKQFADSVQNAQN